MSDSGYTHESFQPIARRVEIPPGVAVRAESPYQSLEDLVEAMKTEQLTRSSSGVGSGPHLAMAMFMDKFDISANHVTSGGNNEALDLDRLRTPSRKATTLSRRRIASGERGS